MSDTQKKANVGFEVLKFLLAALAGFLGFFAGIGFVGLVVPAPTTWAFSNVGIAAGVTSFQAGAMIAFTFFSLAGAYFYAHTVLDHYPGGGSFMGAILIASSVFGSHVVFGGSVTPYVNPMYWIVSGILSGVYVLPVVFMLAPLVGFGAFLLCFVLEYFLMSWLCAEDVCQVVCVPN